MSLAVPVFISCSKPEFQPYGYRSKQLFVTLESLPGCELNLIYPGLSAFVGA
jgi:hypothetical protein